VHVLGTARASILPSPSVTFTNVVVGDPDKPLMTVSRFAATVELVPLIGRQIRVLAMRLDEPVIHVAVDASGAADWLAFAHSTDALAPDSVALTDVSIRHGALDYSDASNGVAFSMSNVNAAVESPSLVGPWKVSGTWGADSRSHFAIATGRRLDDGSIRVKVDASSADWPVKAGLDGSLSVTPADGVKYAGTYDLEQVAAVPRSGAGADAPQTSATVADGWESQGSFTLTRENVVIDKAVVSHNAADGGTSVAGALTVGFGRQAAFDATVEAKQLDLDRALGGSASQPVRVADLATELVGFAADAPAPPLPGRLTVNLPAVVIGGAVAQNVTLVAATAPDGWQISSFTAGLPGDAAISASGKLSTGRQLGFAGQLDVAAGEPQVFAGWWRGTAPPVSAAPLLAFALTGDAAIGIDRFAVDSATAHIGDSTMTGSFSWSRDRQYHREIDADIKADQVDLDALGALTGMVTGASLGDIRALADSYQLRFAADSLTAEGVTASRIAVDAGYAGDTLKVVQISAGDIGGASLRVTGGRIDGLSTASASGHLEAHVDATKFDGLVRLAGLLVPGTTIANWLGSHAASLAPASVDVRVAAPAKDGNGAYGVELSGKAGPTALNVLMESDTRPADVWTGNDRVSLKLDSADSAAFARQLGINAASVANDGGAHLALKMSGPPAKGLVTALDGSFAGLGLDASGTTTFDAATRPAFAGTLKATSDDIRPLLAAASLTLPGLNDNAGLSLSGAATASQAGLALDWRNGAIAGRSIGGKITLSPLAGHWRLSGALDVDLVDVSWLTALGLGAPLAPAEKAGAPWSKAPLSPVDPGVVTADLTLAIDRLALPGALSVERAKAILGETADGVNVTVTDGALAGGKFGGTLSMRNPDGNASLTAQLTVRGAGLAPFVWGQGDAPVADGTFDFTANVAANGADVAALVASATGGGTLALHQTSVHGLNDNALAPIIGASDIGEQYSEDALRSAVESQIGASSIKVADAGGAFAVAGGVARFSGFSVDTASLSLAGDTAFDFNRMTLDSDWTCTFKSVGDDGQPANIGIAFRGPIAAPVRMVDVVPLSSFLSTRQASRMMQTLAIEDADRLEQERFAREILRFRGEGMRADREQKADAAAAQAARAALERAAEATAVARDAALAAAAVAARAADDAHARAMAAAADLARAEADHDAAVADEARTASDLASAQPAFDKAFASATALAKAADALDGRAAAAVGALATVTAAAEKANAALAAANARLAAARSKQTDANAAADLAARQLADANTVLQTTSGAAGAALKRGDDGQAALADADRAIAAAKRDLDQAGAAAAKADQAATTAAAEQARVAGIARTAGAAAASAKAKMAAAYQALEDASKVATNAELDADQAAEQGIPALTLADKRTAAETAHRTMVTDQGRYSDAQAKAADLAARAVAAAADADKAAAVAAQQQAAAASADAQKTAAIAALAGKTKAREAAAAEVATAAAAARTAGAAFDDAQANARAAADRAASTALAAKAADAEVADATRAVAAVAPGPEAAALQQATAARDSTAAAADAAHTTADIAYVASAGAKTNLAAAMTAHDDAKQKLAATATALAAAMKEHADADAAAAAADTAAASAAADARQRTTEATAAAAALSAAGPAPQAKNTVGVPVPRQKPKAASDADTAGQPLQLVPPVQ
jgi:uncharacterized protein involved in outer membrane biogenesis